MSDHPENDPFGETQHAEDPLAAFEAFRAQPKEQPATESFPEQYAAEPTAVLPSAEAEPTVHFGEAQFGEAPFGGTQSVPGPFNAGQYGGADGAYSAGFPPPAPQSTFDYAAPAPAEPASGRGKVRSAVVFGGVAVLAVGLGIGVYAATRSSGGQPAAATPPVTASATPSAGQPNAKTGKAMIARLTVTAVGTDTFTGTTASGTPLSVKIATGTKFGTAARPFTRSQLVPGAVVYVRLRHEADGTAVATVIAAGTADKGSAAASPSTGA